jgi:hypothetical protein
MKTNNTETQDATYQWKYGTDIIEVSKIISVSDIDSKITATESQD